MNTKKIIALVGNFLLGICILALGLNYLSKTAEDIDDPQAVVFQGITNMQKRSVIANSTISEKGNLKLGQFAAFQLTGSNPSIKLEKLQLQQNTQSILEAKANVRSGNIIAINLVFGPRLILEDERVSVENQGGSFSFEKNSYFSKIKVASGSAKLTLKKDATAETYQATLIAGEEITIDDELAMLIFDYQDPIDQATEWRRMVNASKTKMDGEKIFLVDLVEQLKKEERGSLTNSIRWIEEKILFMPKAIKKFYSEEAKELLYKVAYENAEEASNFLDNLTVNKLQKFKEAAISLQPYTQMFLSKALSPSMKKKIVALANFSEKFAEFNGAEKLPESLKISQNILFIENNPEDKQLVKDLSKLASSTIDTDQAANSRQILFLIKKYNRFDLVDAYHALSSNLINTRDQLATAILDQLELVEKLINENEEALAGKALKQLAYFLSRSDGKISKKSLEQISKQGNELKNKILFLASLPKNKKFSLKEYQIWISQQQAQAELKNQRIMRPKTEAEKFLNMFEGDFLAEEISEEAYSEHSSAETEKPEPSEFSLEYISSEFGVTHEEVNLSTDGILTLKSEFENSCQKKTLSNSDIEAIKRTIQDEKILEIVIPEDSPELICEGSEYLTINTNDKEKTIYISCTAGNDRTEDVEKIRSFVDNLALLGPDFEDCKNQVDEVVVEEKNDFEATEQAQPEEEVSNSASPKYSGNIYNSVLRMLQVDYSEETSEPIQEDIDNIETETKSEDNPNNFEEETTATQDVEVVETPNPRKIKR